MCFLNFLLKIFEIFQQFWKYLYFFCSFPEWAQIMIQMRQTLYLRLCSAFSSNKFQLLFLAQLPFPEEFQYLIYSFQKHSWDPSQVAAVIKTFYSLKHIIPCDTFYLSLFCGDYNFSCPMGWDVLILFRCFELQLSNRWKMNILYNAQFGIFLPFQVTVLKGLPVSEITLCLLHIALVLYLALAMHFILVICAGLS